MHNRECPKCGSIGEWNWKPEREELTMPNGETIMAKLIMDGEPAVKCPECGHKFEPHSHAKLEKKLKEIQL